MTVERQIPGGAFVAETGFSQAQIPGGALLNDNLFNNAALTATESGDTASLQAATAVVSVTGPTPAGKRRNRRRYYVEIDGQQFIVDTPEQAQALLQQAQGLAEQAAQEDAERIVSAALPRIRALGKVDQVKLAPRIKTDVRTPEVERIKAEIARIYAEAAHAAELRLLMERKAIQDDEDEAEELMLMGML